MTDTTDFEFAAPECDEMWVSIPLIKSPKLAAEVLQAGFLFVQPGRPNTQRPSFRVCLRYKAPLL